MKKFHKTRPVKLFRHLLLAVFLLKLLVVMVLLPYRLSVAFGGALGTAAGFLLPSYRRRVDKNIKASLPELWPLEARKVRIDHFRHIGMCLSEFALLGFRSKSFWLSKVDMEGLDILNANVGKKGVIILGAHIGNWELFGAYLSMIGLRVNVVAREIYDSRLNRMVVQLRKSSGVNTIYREGRANTKKMIGALKNKEILGILIDQDTRVGGIFVDFFGRPAYTPTACSQFARLKETVIVPGFIYRKPDLTHKIVVLDPVEGGVDQEAETQAYTKIIENFIRKHPSQWVWIHQRWKRKHA